MTHTQHRPLAVLAATVADSGPVVVLAAIAAAGSFTHIRDTARGHGQHGWMAWAIAVCIDLTCVMAARERQRDKRTGRERAVLSWPTLVLVGGILLSLAANLAQAQPSVWGWVVAGTPAAAFLVAISMLERRAGARPAASCVPSPDAMAVPPSFGVVPDRPSDSSPAVPVPSPLVPELAAGHLDRAEPGSQTQIPASAVPPSVVDHVPASASVGSDAPLTPGPPRRRRLPDPERTPDHPRRVASPAGCIQPTRLRPAPPDPHPHRRLTQPQRRSP